MIVKKIKNKRRKLYHFANLVNDFNYFDFSRGAYTLDGVKYPGELFALDKPDEKKLEAIYKKYDNVAVLTRTYKYAPEIKDTCIFIAN